MYGHGSTSKGHRTSDARCSFDFTECESQCAHLQCEVVASPRRFDLRFPLLSPWTLRIQRHFGIEHHQRIVFPVRHRPAQAVNGLSRPRKKLYSQPRKPGSFNRPVPSRECFSPRSSTGRPSNRRVADRGFNGPIPLTWWASMFSTSSAS